MSRPKLDFMNHGSFLMIQGLYDALDKELIEKIIENIKRNCQLGYCKNCKKLYIINSPTHEICWRCREKDRNETTPQEL